MNKQDIVNQLITNRSFEPIVAEAIGQAPSNIALVKYWGKRDEQLHLPVNDSLSISLADQGAITRLKLSDCQHDVVYLNHRQMASDHPFCLRLSAYLDLFRYTEGKKTRKKHYFHIDTISRVPVAAGLASSACGFAALIKALDQWFGWQLSINELSILARLGSGSACRSLWHGFVRWRKGHRQDGMDSHGEYVAPIWPSLRVGMLVLSRDSKPISSRIAMKQTVDSPFYRCWAQVASQDLTQLRQAIDQEDFHLLAQTAERNALAMHACMLTALPAVMYALPQTVAAMNKVWQLRHQGLPLFFTQDAGPNLKLLFLDKHCNDVVQEFPELMIINPSTAGKDE